jgi:3-hydroxyacyl-[acyl-carrier-protein] dehydratase
MLFTDFYQIDHINRSDLGTTFYIKLNPNHFIYNGHFPGQPVLPGVCALQIIKECAQQLINRKLQYKRITLCKFLRFVDPVQNSEIMLTVSVNENEDGVIQLLANGMCNDFYFIKMKAVVKSLE